ncbi:MAG TPA: RdgB/HAM1 family non-canonical purine NTP pyrophosphatase [Burkholderiales bacterium]|jgi:XTP/dITP diphosphohydrolase|nr:RdgB/HAM1 family non-canonical purine NTP pyrophosphatase [Burkholderiales bacterium]
MKKIVIASGNPGKLREFEQMLTPLGIEIIPQSRLGIPETDEPHATFVENALAKARHASRLAGLPALADDSGICMAALGGEPGVHSARFAAEEPADRRDAQDRRNNAKLIALLKDRHDRRAHYYCVIVLTRRSDDPEPLIVEGRWHGEVIDTPRGANGFGYDPYFYLSELDRTAAELPPEKKNAISHRGQALAVLLARLRAEQCVE